MMSELDELKQELYEVRKKSLIEAEDGMPNPLIFVFGLPFLWIMKKMKVQDLKYKIKQIDKKH